MKKLQKFLIVVLCVCALTGLMATSASAASTLDKAAITIDGPVVGNEPTKTANLDAASTAAGCYVKSVKWSGTLNQWNKFQGGETYTAAITLGIRDNYDWKFSDQAFDATVNGTLMDEVTWYSDQELVVTAEFEKTPAPTIINEASFTITSPEAGKTPDQDPKIPDGAPYFVFKVTWSNLKGGKFQENTSHTANVTLQIHSDKNTWFSDKTFNAYVNGTLIDEIEWHSNNEIVVPVVFEKTAAAPTTEPTVLKEARVTLTAPETGKTPAKSATVPSGVDYTVKKVEWKGSLSSGKFKADTSYTAYVTLGIKSGKNAAFSNEVFDAYVNDYLIDEVTWNSSREIVVPVVFEKTAAAQTSKPTALNAIHLTIGAPAWGKKPSTTASLPSNARSTVEKVEWSGQLDIDGTFMPRTKYKVTVTLGIKPGSNCVFSDKSINGTVNGKKADDVLWYADDKVQVIYTFPAFATGDTITIAHITIDGPAVGEKPATTAHMPSTASTYIRSIKWSGKLDSNGCFQAGTVYTADITLGIKSNLDRKFSTKTFDAYVNGVLMDEVTRVSDKELIVSVEFEKTPGSAPSTAPETPVTSFSDVKASDYFAEPVAWAVNNKITSGTGNNQFSPNENCTQAQILTFLWRATGSPEPAGTMAAEGFSGTEYYYKAVLWAAERGMIQTGGFDPEVPCTRAMAVTFMWNYAGSPANSPSSFTDVPTNADYAQAVAWAVKQGVTSGIGDNQFGPSQTCTRGQIVSFLYRAFAK